MLVPRPSDMNSRSLAMPVPSPVLLVVAKDDSRSYAFSDPEEELW